VLARVNTAPIRDESGVAGALVFAVPIRDPNAERPLLTRLTSRQQHLVTARRDALLRAPVDESV
jgi:hypothetical protein